MNIGKQAKAERHESELDDIDKKILRTMMSDPRLSLRDIAADSGTSVGTVRDRLFRLQKDKTIRGYTTIVDPHRAGYRITAIIEVFESKKGLGVVESVVKDLHNICAVYSVTGSTDVVIIARFTDSDELNDFVRKILKLKNVLRTETLIVLDTYKEDFRPIV